VENKVNISLETAVFMKTNTVLKFQQKDIMAHDARFCFAVSIYWKFQLRPYVRYMTFKISNFTETYSAEYVALPSGGGQSCENIVSSIRRTSVTESHRR
jgi:hypothetical protein